jgi:FG-GAP-like repeat
MSITSLGQPITLGQTITDVFTGYLPTSVTNIFNPLSFTDYIIPSLPNFEQIGITLNLNNNPALAGSRIRLYDVATDKILAAESFAGQGLFQTTYPGITYGIEVYNDSVSAADLSGVPLAGTYSLSFTDRGQATSIVSASTFRVTDLLGGGDRYPAQIGTVNAAGKYSTLATASVANATPDDVALSPSGLFYGVKSSNNLLTADKLLVIDPSNGNGLQISNGVNLKDTAGNVLFKRLNSLAFSSDNQLYAIGRNAAEVSELYQIDVNTNVATLISTLPAGLNTAAPSGNTGDLIYDAANKRFLVASVDTTASSNALWQIPLDNPAGATKIGNIGFSRIVGLSFENGQLTGIIGDNSFGPEGKVIINTSTGVGTLDPAFPFVYSVLFTGATSILPPAKNTRNDFNGDGKSDILWRNDYGSVAVWQMNGATVTSGSLTSVPNVDPSWKVTGTSDFNGDGKSDILWRNTNGSVAVWTMNGSTVISSSLASTSSLDNSWKTAGTGDYNGDGKADILWRNDNGSIAVWTMNGATVTSSALTSTPALDNSWKVAGNSDFNGDGKADILWRNDDGSIALWQMNGAAITSSTAIAKLSTDWKIAGTGDFNGDNKADILWRNDDGRVVLWQMNGAAISSSSLTSTPSRDSSQTIAGIGDYNGDGKADILWRKDTGVLEVWQMNGSTVVSSTPTSVAADGGFWKIAAPII